MFKRLLGLALLFASAASAQIVVSPQAIVVNPRPSFDVDVWLDRDTSGDNAPSYAVGEEVRISVRPAETSYVYVFDVKPNGEITQIFPNRFDDNNRVSGGQTMTIPPNNARYVFNIAPPRGLFQPRRKQLVTELAKIDPIAAARVRTFTASTGRDAFRAVISLANHVLGVDTFFEWTSDRS